MTEKPQRIEGLDFLRGFASLAVCFFHLTSINYKEPDQGFYPLLRQAGAYGWLGVEVFFVISGFVIPYSLYTARYRIRNYFTFVLRRVVRLDPPYLVAIAVILLLAYLFAWHSGLAPEVEGQPIGLSRVLLHFGYLNMFAPSSWLNPAFWTLAIEIQYYLLMGLLFPLVVNRNRLIRLATLAVMGTIGLLSVPVFFPTAVPYSPFISRFLCLFLLGIVTLQLQVGVITVSEYVPAIVIAGGLSLLTLGLPSTLAGLAAVAIILAYRGKQSLISSFFSKISYSLYLLHWPVAYFTLNLLVPKFLKAESGASRTLAFFICLGVSLVAAYVLYATVERPAQMWSKRFRYSRKETGKEEAETAPYHASGTDCPA